MSEVDQSMDAQEANDSVPASEPRTEPQEPPRVTFDEAQQRELQRIVAREVQAAKRRAQQEAEESRARQEAEAKGEYQRLLADAEKQRDEYRNSIRQMEAERVVEVFAKRSNAEHPEVIYRLIKDDLEYGDDGKPTNVEELVADLKRDYPRYFVAPVAVGADAGKSGGDPTTGDMNQVLRRAANRR